MAKDIIPPYARAYLIQVINGVKQAPIEITDDVTNWQELEIRHSRDGFSGVFVDVSQELKVCDSKPDGTWTQGNGKRILHDIFMAHGLSAQVYLEIRKRENHGFGYSLVYRGMLDFGTYAEERDFVTIGSESRDFNSLVSSLGKTKYDIPVANLPTVEWRYRHNEMVNNGSWTMPESTQHIPYSFDGVTTVRVRPSINLDSAEMVLNGIPNDIKGQGLGVGLDDYFFKSAAAQTVRVTFDFDVAWGNPINNGSLDPPPAFTLKFARVGSSGNIKETLVSKQGTSRQNPISDFLFSGDVTMENGDTLAIFVEFTVGESNSSGSATAIFRFKEVTALSITYIDTAYEVIVDDGDTETVQTYTSIPVVSPVNFSNALLAKMATSIEEAPYTTQIDTDDLATGYGHFLVAGESIRGWENDNFHTSYNDFLEYMQFLGYEWEVNEDTRQVIFHMRGYFFTPEITALDLTKEEVAGLVMKAEPEHAYSTVKIGYEKPDIENTNGKFAICGTNDYTTDYKGVPTKENVLEIQCPYKADPVEIEVLSWSRGEKTKDTKNDNDIFMLAGVRSGATVTEYRGLQYVATVDNLFRVKFYNAPYIPYFIAVRNADKAGIAASILKFAGTDAFREATLTGTDPNRTADIYGNISITNKLFSPIIYEFEAGTHHDLPDLQSRRGVVVFIWQGEQKQGYIQEIVKNPRAEQGVTWTLLAK